MATDDKSDGVFGIDTPRTKLVLVAKGRQLEADDCDWAIRCLKLTKRGIAALRRDEPCYCDETSARNCPQHGG